MKTIIFLNSRERKKILEKINSYYGTQFETTDSMYFGSQDKIFLISKDIQKIPLERYNLRNAGLYFAQLMNNEIRLSIEGSQLIGKTATKHILKVNKEFINKLKQEKFEYNEETGFYIISYNKIILGCIRISKNTVNNYIPKARRNYL